ncbi:MAG: NADH-quinone oxidoreductase subunit H [Acidimicrobiia bacterium]|nr:NADH-quinone oxidoreductase subunit H [Acidimicrobiia bacterium]
MYHSSTFILSIVDPIDNSKFDLTTLLIILGKAVAIFVILLVGVMLYIWSMRKVIADMQNRIGPSKAGPFGVLQSLADGTKLFFKEQSIPDNADRSMFRLAPYFAIVPAFLAFAIIPIGGTVTIAGHKTNLQLVELPMGILWLLMMSGLGLYGVLLAGWSSGSKYPLLGSIRASAQLLSYEATIGLAIAGAVIQSGSLSTRTIVDTQNGEGIWSFAHIGDWPLFKWFLIPAFISFLLFLLSAVAETNHPPFDLVEAEQELVGGFHTEYTGIRFAIFFLAEFMNLITMSAVGVTLFLGGTSGPLIGSGNWIDTWILPSAYFMAKLLLLLYGTVWLRATLPRLRYDQLMGLAWKYLIELSFLWVAALLVLRVSKSQAWSFVSGSEQITGVVVSLITVVTGFLIFVVLSKCIPSENENTSTMSIVDNDNVKEVS